MLTRHLLFGYYLHIDLFSKLAGWFPLNIVPLFFILKYETMKSIIHCVFLSTLALFISGNGFAQIKYADLEIVINQPSDSTSFQWGDTAKFSFYIQNNGPDTLGVADSLSISFLHFHQSFPLTGVTLNPGDTLQFNDAASLWNDDPATNDAGRFCMSVHVVSLNIIDSNRSNDTSCIAYFLEGNGNSGIKQPGIKSIPLIKVFPNPASGRVTIQLNALSYRKLRLSVTDILGREVLFHDYSMKARPNDHVLHFNVSDFQPGTYFVRLIADGQTFVNKLIVR